MVVELADYLVAVKGLQKVVPSAVLMVVKMAAHSVVSLAEKMGVMSDEH